MPGTATEEPMDAIAAELEAARVLLSRQQELESALTSGEPGEALLACVQRQEAALRDVRTAAHARRLLFPKAGTFESFLATRPSAEAERGRRLAREAIAVREEIGRAARRGEYVARRVGEWTRANLEIVVRAASGPAVTYDAPGASRRPRRSPSLLDRSA